ncbi:uncharacterized protein LOC128726750 [Anopheles nili]|uniref:uncharacterized protein LOC128726750 n=1 Tax=Anopheles nili TaxID=185578 RepID=UPI00237A8E25|nr:uncharacterized protein LOC128726750 [Anopheles nili]
MIDDDEDDYEGYFLRPANEYNIKEKIIQANQESFAIPTPPSPRQHVSGERRVTFREQLVDYEPDDYSSEDDGYGGGGGGKGHKKNALIETVADVHREGEEDGGDASNTDTILEELQLEDHRATPEGADDPEEHGHGLEDEEAVVEEEQLEGDYDEEGEGQQDRMEKHKTGVEGESLASEEEDEVEEQQDEEEEEEEINGAEEEEEEEPTEGSSMDTEIHNPESSEDISSSPLKTYRSEADSRSGSGDSQAEEAGIPGEGEEEDYNRVSYDDNDYDHSGPGEERNGGPDGESSSDGERPLEAHRTKRSTTCRRKCCRHKKSSGEKLPYYNGFRSEYGLSREELEEKKRRLEARRQRVRERKARRSIEQRQKAQSNEEAFAAWLHGKLRNSINKHQNMYDVKQGSSSGRQQQQDTKFRRRNGIFAMHQLSYG